MGRPSDDLHISHAGYVDCSERIARNALLLANSTKVSSYMIKIKYEIGDASSMALPRTNVVQFSSETLQPLCVTFRISTLATIIVLQQLYLELHASERLGLKLAFMSTDRGSFPQDCEE
jgi:hypothetical protein